MKLPAVCLAAALVVVALVAAGFTQPPPPPPPTKVPAPPTAAVSPTKAPEATKALVAAQPTAVPTKTVKFPEKGKTITAIVPFAAGGSTDVGARLIADAMEKELGVPILVVNKPGAATQIGMTALATSKPDGYTISFTSMPSFCNSYLDPESKATYTRKHFELIGRSTAEAIGLSVKSDSPFKDVKDLVQAAKAKPEQIKMGLGGILGVNHMNVLLLEKIAGIKFAPVQFAGGAPVLTAILGGHIDVGTNASAELLSQFKSGALRVLGLFDRAENKFFPAVKTLEAQGYKVALNASGVVAVPGGTPQEIKDVLAQTFKKALDSPDLQAKFAAAGLEIRYLDQAQVTTLWSEIDAEIKPLIEAFRKRQ